VYFKELKEVKIDLEIKCWKLGCIQIYFLKFRYKACQDHSFLSLKIKIHLFYCSVQLRRLTYYCWGTGLRKDHDFSV